MDTELIFPVLSRWGYIGCAIVLIGGSSFIWLVVQPVLGTDNADLHDRLRNRWKKFVHPGILIFLVSGIYNLVKMIPHHKGDALYHSLIGTKFLLALAVFALASILVGNKPGTQKVRDNARKWLGVTLLLALVIVGISGFVKVRPYSAPVAPALTDAPESP